jgi:integrase/recombinase XerD
MTMSNNAVVSIFLDKRRPKKSGKFPIKLRVYMQILREQKLYPLNYEFSEKEYEDIWLNNRPLKENREIRLKLQFIENNAYNLAKKITPFSFSTFERMYFDNQYKNKNDIGYYYEQAIKIYRQNNQIGTAENYDLSLKSLLKFHGKNSLPISFITAQWLEDYERNMIEVNKRSQTTVGFYLRPLRAVFNTAIANKSITTEQYPFGKRKYTIPAPKSVKKALNKDQLTVLFKCKPKTMEQKKARDLWFFSYSCNGMNFKDIATLKFQDIKGETLTFNRAKTKRTNKSQAPSIIYLNNFTKKVIANYGNRNGEATDYVFDFLSNDDSALEIERKVSNIIRYVNQHLKTLAKSIGIEEEISTYWARHSFATAAIRQGASMEFVSEALRHSNLNTTKGYFAGFEDEKKKEINAKLMEF